MTDKYAPLTPTELAKELNVPLTQRQQPNLRDHMPARIVKRAEAEARGMSLYWESAACRFGHQSARSVAHDGCTDCARLKEGKDTIYPRSKAQEFRTVTKKTNAEKAAAPVAIAPAPPELSAADVKLLAAIDTARDFDAAAKACNTTRGLIEARASSYPLFRTALDDLCQRRGIPWTRAPDPESFNWTPDIERALCRRYVDVGLLEQARQELGISASQFHAHLASSPEFAAAVMASETTARSTLRERAMAAAAVGNDRLAKLLEEDSEDMFTDPTGRRVSYINPEQMRADMTAMLAEVKAMINKKDRLLNVIRENSRKTATPADEFSDGDLT